MNAFNNIASWFVSLFRVWRREFYLVFNDAGVMLFFFALPTLYPIVYTLIYNPEIVEKMPVVVVDDSRSALSRDFVRKLGATQSAKIEGYASNMAEARRCFDEHKVFAVVHIPRDYAKNIVNGRQGVVDFYCNVALLLRYRAYLQDLTNLQLALGQEIQINKVESYGLLGEATGLAQGSPINSESIMLGDPTSGFASFVIPGILVLILQQSMILGVMMLAGGASERRRRNFGVDPLAVPAGAATQVVGKTLCYLALYIPLTLYILHIVPTMFSLPHVGNIWHELMLMTPMIIAAALMGITFSPLVTEREASMPVFVFTSVMFLFLSGLTWPRYAMNRFWQLVGDMVPATWGVEGFIRINSNGATLAEQREPYLMMWGLVVIYFITAWVICRVRQPRRAPRPVS